MPCSGSVMGVVSVGGCCGSRGWWMGTEDGSGWATGLPVVGAGRTAVVECGDDGRVSATGGSADGDCNLSGAAGDKNGSKKHPKKR